MVLWSQGLHLSPPIRSITCEWACAWEYMHESKCMRLSVCMRNSVCAWEWVRAWGWVYVIMWAWLRCVCAERWHGSRVLLAVLCAVCWCYSVSECDDAHKGLLLHGYKLAMDDSYVLPQSHHLPVITTWYVLLTHSFYYSPRHYGNTVQYFVLLLCIVMCSVPDSSSSHPVVM